MGKLIKVRLLVAAILILALSLPAVAGVRFLPPGDERPLFRRDLLPLETDTIPALSRHLTGLVRRDLEEEDAASLRAQAQLIALALQLDPVNQRARQRLRQLREGGEIRARSSDEIASDLADIEAIATWLLAPAAGSEGRLLAQLIVDPLRVLHPDLALCRLAGPEGEAERWRGTVPPVTAYLRSQPDQPLAEPETTAPGAPETGSQQRPRFSSATVTLQTPVYLVHEGGRGWRRWSKGQQELVTAQLDLIPEFAEGSFLDFPGEPDNVSSAVEERVRHVLTKEWGALPADQAHAVSLSSNRYNKRNQLTLSGPLALMLHASLSRATLRPDLILLGAISREGIFELPVHGWTALKSAFSGESSGGRLLVPASAGPQIRDLLVLEKNSFFVNYEVFGVNSLEDALVLGRTDGTTDLAEASRLFAEFQEVAKGKQLGELSSNSHVRERMTRILELAPNHYSARMVLLHGSPSRPLKFRASTVALELAECLEIMQQSLGDRSLPDLKPASLRKSEERCLELLKALKEHTTTPHQKLVSRFEHTTKRLGRLSRTLEEIDFEEIALEGAFDQRAIRSVMEQHENFKSEYKALSNAVKALSE